jgi:hypothetical protein
MLRAGSNIDDDLLFVYLCFMFRAVECPLATITLLFARFQVSNFAGMETYQEVLEPLLVWIIGRINDVIYDPANAGVLKYLVFDELGKHLKTPSLVEGLIEALKTGRKNLVGWTLLTQSAGDLGQYVDRPAHLWVLPANPLVQRTMSQSTSRTSRNTFGPAELGKLIGRPIFLPVFVRLSAMFLLQCKS